MTYIGNIVRSAGDPKVLTGGPSSLAGIDQLGRFLGWFGIVLGLAELLAPRRFARALGMTGREGLLRACGARELGSGIVTLSPDAQVGLWSRVLGDGLDLFTLANACSLDNPRRKTVGWAIWMVAGVTLLDVVAAQMVAARHARREGEWRDYSDRSGFPRGVASARQVRQG